MPIFKFLLAREFNYLQGVENHQTDFKIRKVEIAVSFCWHSYIYRYESTEYEGESCSRGRSYPETGGWARYLPHSGFFDSVTNEQSLMVNISGACGLGCAIMWRAFCVTIN